MVPFGLPHLERGLSGGKPNCPVDGEDSTIPCSGSFVTFQSITWEEQSTFRPPKTQAQLSCLKEVGVKTHTSLPRPTTPLASTTYYPPLMRRCSAVQQFRLEVAFSLLSPIVAAEPSSAARDTIERTREVPKACTLG